MVAKKGIKKAGLSKRINRLLYSPSMSHTAELFYSVMSVVQIVSYSVSEYVVVPVVEDGYSALFVLSNRLRVD